MFDMILAIDSGFGIGKNNTIPWKLSADLKRFKQITTTVSEPAKQNAVIMGWNTWLSLPKKPLPNRVNCVLTTEKIEQALCSLDFDLTLNQLYQKQDIENIFVIGGKSVYEEAFKHKDLRYIYLTMITNKSFDCDVVLNGADILSKNTVIRESSTCIIEDDLHYFNWKLERTSL